MPTLVNDVAISVPTQLSEGDVGQLGSTPVVFHDLSAGDKRSAKVHCGFCNAENDDRRSECWRCGENLANAKSAVYETSRVESRVVPLAGTVVDLVRDDTFALSPQGTGEVVARDGGSYLRLEAGASPSFVNGQPADNGRRLKTGDILGLGESSVLVIVR